MIGKLVVALLVIQATFFNLIAQPYLIPGAMQQPAWVFPIFLEDAIGQKDTVYICYDGAFSNNFGCFDEGLFNEVMTYNYVFDSTKFVAFTCLDSGVGGHDSIGRIEVTNFKSVNDFALYVRNAYYPLLIKWDSSVLWYDSVPFPPNSPNLPNAEVLLDWFWGTNIPNDINCLSSGILITDTCNFICCTPDSMVFNDSGGWPGPISSLFAFTFRPWSGIVVGNSELNFVNDELTIYPNPFSTEINIHVNFNSKNQLEFELFDIHGKSKFRTVLKLENSNNEYGLNIKHLENGVYFSRIIVDNNIYYQKLIKIQ
jgi:Secretion system C-terminal sorting domain